MKNSIALILAILAILLVNSCIFHKRFYNAQNFKPPGTLPLDSTLFLDDTEIANISWLEFLFYVKDSLSKEEFNLLLPDTTVFSKLPNDSSYFINFSDSACAPYTVKKKYKLYGTYSEDDVTENNYQVYYDHYLRYPGFRYHPVVGLRYHAAVAYSLWRSNIVEQGINNVLAKKKKPYRYLVDYRLPNKQDYVKAIKGNEGKIFSFYLYKEYCKQFQSCFPLDSLINANVRHKGYCEGKTVNYPRFFSIEQHYSRSPTKNGFYGLIGNVAEFTNEPDSVWGKSLIDELSRKDLLHPELLIDYNIGGNFYTGFRNACDLKKVPAEDYKAKSVYRQPEFRECFAWLKAWKTSDSVKAMFEPTSTNTFLVNQKRFYQCEIPDSLKLFDTLHLNNLKIPIGDVWRLKLDSITDLLYFPLSDLSIDSLQISLGPGKRELYTCTIARSPQTGLFTFPLNKNQFFFSKTSFRFYIKSYKEKRVLKSFMFEVIIE